MRYAQIRYEKCSCVEVDGQLVDVFKNPITDSGKISKKEDWI